MKLRSGFVSNSSSSSFIIYKPLLTDKQLKKIRKWYNDNEDEIFDDHGAFFSESGNYVSLNCHSKSEEFCNILTEMGIKDDDIYYSYS